MLKLKALTPIIVAVLALIGTIVMGIIQSGSARESTIKDLVDQLNQDTIPRIQDSLSDIRERLAAIEALNRIKHEPRMHIYRNRDKANDISNGIDAPTAKSNVMLMMDTQIPKLEMLDAK